MQGEKTQERARADARRRAGAALALGGALLIGALTLHPRPEDAADAARSPFYCLLCGDFYAVDFLLNVALFVPLGAGLRLWGCSRQRAQMCALLATLGVELAQATLLAGRDPALGDVLANGLGGALGIALVDAAGWWLWPSTRLSRALAAGATLLWLGLTASVGWLVQPSLPAGRWFAQVPPQGIYREDFRGELRAASLNGTPLHSLEFSREAGGRLRAELLRAGVALQASARLGPAPPSRLAGLVSLSDGRGRELLVLGQRGADLIFRVRARAARFGLRTPAIRLAGVLPTQPGASLEARAGLERGELRLEARAGAQGSTAVTRPLSPSWGWVLLLPFEYALGPEAGVLCALWVGALALPLGYWAGRGLRGAVRTAVLVLGAVGALAGVPALLGLCAAPPLEWAAAAAALLGGCALARLGLRRERAAP